MMKTTGKYVVEPYDKDSTTPRIMLYADTLVEVLEHIVVALYAEKCHYVIVGKNDNE